MKKKQLKVSERISIYVDTMFERIDKYAIHLMILAFFVLPALYFVTLLDSCPAGNEFICKFIAGLFCAVSIVMGVSILMDEED